MGRNKQALSNDKFNTVDSWDQLQTGNKFLIRKAKIELEVTLHEFSVQVQVSSCRQEDCLLAASIARIQEKLLPEELRLYTGRHPFAYLLTFYANQGWMIQITEPVTDE